ncbi:MAG: GIY-YIG nuclease family protein [Caldilineaceae bacterium]
MDTQPAITVVGEPRMQGVYVLRLHLATPIAVTFGRFQRGQPIPIPVGDYLYIGSALGRQGATTLAGRLLRHTTRSGDRPPHAIQPLLRTQLQERGLIATARTKTAQSKRLFWHIDYLVDRMEAEISQIFILHTNQRLESNIACTLAADPAVTAVASGLGASDDPHATHLLRVDAPACWWHNLPQLLVKLSTDS